jgi:hypothetical protein
VVTASPQILVDGAIARIGSWLESLAVEFDNAATLHQERLDQGAVHYVALLQALLTNYQRAFERYRAQSSAPSDLRLQWLQQVGAGLAQLENLFGRLSVPVAPTLTPLLAAFSRLLGKLVPGRPPIFRPVRDFNYELEEFHSSEFADLLLAATNEHLWPVLFITLPTGLLDTPRAHVLVAHEIGHAVAAVHREKVVLTELERAKAQAEGKPAGAPIAPLLSKPKPPRSDVLQIAKERWTETGLPAPQTSSPQGGKAVTADGALLLEVVAAVGADVDDILESWLEELFSDAIGTCLFGPAFFESMLEVLLTTGSLDRGTASHPPLAARLQCIGRTLQHAEVGFRSDQFPATLKGRFDKAMADAGTVLAATPTISSSETRLNALVRGLAIGMIDDIVTIALKAAKAGGLLYTATQFESDVRQYLTEFVQAGVPPLGKDVSLASVFNVGQVLCSDHLAAFCPGVDDRDKEKRVDDLMLKAIEVNEMAVTWTEA